MTNTTNRTSYKDYQKMVETELENGIKEKGLKFIEEFSRNDSPFNPVTKTIYRGTNRLWLGLVALKKGYTDPRWLTFKQMTEKGYSLKAKDEKKGYQKGDQKAVEIMYFIPRYLYDLDKDGNIDFRHGKSITEEEYKALSEKDKKRVFTKTIKSWVFNAEQMNGIPALEKKETKVFSTKLADHIAKKLGVSLVWNSPKENPCYSSATDTVYMPNVTYKEEKYMLANVLHEFSHATGHKSRLGRDLKNMFGSSAYAFEELVAESSATMLCAILGIEKTVDKNHKAYIKSWLNYAKDHENALLKAFKLAEQSCDYIMNVAELDAYSETEQESVSEPVKETKKRGRKATKKAEKPIAKPKAKATKKEPVKKTATKKAETKKSETKKAETVKMMENIVNGIAIVRIELTKADGNIAWIEMTKDFYNNLKKSDKKRLEKAWGLA